MIRDVRWGGREGWPRLDRALNPPQRFRHAALLRATGYEDAPALTAQSTDGDIPHGRELSFAWLSGTVLTGLTSVLLMGAALYVSFQGQDTFSTAYEALQLGRQAPTTAPNTTVKTNRARPVARTHSEVERIEASVQETEGGRDIIRKQDFVRLRATLATAATALSDDIPTYDPAAFLSSAAPETADSAAEEANTNIYGAEVDGEVAMKISAWPAGFVPPVSVTDRQAAEYVQAASDLADIGPDAQIALAYAAPSLGGGGQLRDLGTVPNVITGAAENVTAVPMNDPADANASARTERILTIREPSPLDDVLRKNGFNPELIGAITATLHNVYPETTLPAGAHLRILFGTAAGNSDTLVPYRMTIYVGEKPAATVALTDSGQYVLALPPPDIDFPAEDTEQINVAALPSLYRSIWETGRKHDVPDDIIRRIIGMYAYDVDLTKRVEPGDTIEMLETPPDKDGNQDLIYVDLKLGSTDHELFRFRQDDGTIDFFDPSGESGKRFLVRRPLEGGGRETSAFGWRYHPVFHRRLFHTGVDLAAPTGTPIYAAGDGVVERAGWASGYGRFVLIKHVNGYETGYGHMSRIAKVTKPGASVHAGEVIGYVGATGDATGPHLHFEIRINGNFVDPLSVKLPRDKVLPAQDSGRFAETVTQIRDLMKREGTPISEVASAQ